MLASINGTDITPYIQESSYEANDVGEYEEWKDGNRRKHRTKLRSAVEGSFSLVFVTATALNSFLTLLENNSTAAKLITMRLYIQNTNTTGDYDVFYEFENTDSRQISTDYFYKKFRFSFEER